MYRWQTQDCTCVTDGGVTEPVFQYSAPFFVPNNASDCREQLIMETHKFGPKQEIASNPVTSISRPEKNVQVVRFRWKILLLSNIVWDRGDFLRLRSGEHRCLCNYKTVLYSVGQLTP